jgi:hypothetical protein
MDGAFKKGFPREQDHTGPGQPELREHHPSTFEKIKSGLNSVGGAFGYPDLAERTGETIDLVSLPSMLGAFGPGAAAVRGSGPAWDAAMAKVLERRYPAAAPTVQPGYAAEVYGMQHGAFGYGANIERQNQSLLNARRGDMKVQKAGRDGLINDNRGVVDPEGAKYLNELMVQQNRKGLRAVK